MKIELDGAKILTEIFELDGTIHSKIRGEVQRRLVEKAVNEIESEYFANSWQVRKDEIRDSVLKEVKEKQDEIVKKILRDFYDGYRYGKKDIAILKKLKELLDES